MNKGVGIFEADTLIRATLHLNPDELTDEEWVHQAAMAVWMEDYRVSRIARMFGGGVDFIP